VTISVKRENSDSQLLLDKYVVGFRGWNDVVYALRADKSNPTRFLELLKKTLGAETTQGFDRVPWEGWSRTWRAGIPRPTARSAARTVTSVWSAYAYSCERLVRPEHAASSFVILRRRVHGRGTLP
jgi:hypothetical protein